MEGNARIVGRVLVLGLGLGGLVFPARAAVCDIHLKSGLCLRGDVVQTNDELTLQNAAGQVTLRRADILRIVPVESTAAQPATQVAAPVGEPAPATEPTAPPEPGELAPAPPLSKADIQRLRLHEIFLTGAPENLRIQFEKKGRQRDVTVEVLEELRKRPDYQPAWEETLTRGLPAEKLQLILRETGTKYAERIKILSDPEVFSTFRQRVLPIVEKGCARSGCHTGAMARVFRFPLGTRTSDTYTYTMFVLLDQMQTPTGPLLDRSSPERSLLLNYLLPSEATERGHPPVKRGPPLKAVLWGRDDPQFGALAEWIRSLSVPRPDYGLEYENPYPGQPPVPAEEPVPATPAEPVPESQPATTEPASAP